MKHGRFLPGIALTASLGLLATGCGGGTAAEDVADKSADFGFNAEGLPIVDETLTLTFGGEKSALAPDYSEMALVQQ